MISIKTSHAGFLLVRDRFRIPRKYVYSMSLLLGIGLLVAWLMRAIREPDFMPISKVHVQGTFVHVSGDMLHHAVGPLARGFFAIDVAEIQERVEALPWVRQASVRRMWPDTLSVSIIEQDAIARWGQKSLMSREGKIFTPSELNRTTGLPMLNGPPGTEQIMNLDLAKAAEIVNGIGLKPEVVFMDERHSVQVTLDNNIKLVVGKDDLEGRLQRFVKGYKYLGKTYQYFDLRYTNGIAAGNK